jgi:MFS family permease
MEKQSLIQNVGFFHPTRRFYRYTVLAVISLICFGSYFAFDEIQPIADDLDTYLGINTEMFTVLYSVYSIPNMILVFFGGILGDKIGLRLAGLIFVSLTLAGSLHSRQVFRMPMSSWLLAVLYLAWEPNL